MKKKIFGFLLAIVLIFTFGIETSVQATEPGPGDGTIGGKTCWKTYTAGLGITRQCGCCCYIWFTTGTGKTYKCKVATD